MAFTREKAKLEELLHLIAEIDVHTDRNIELLNDCYTELRKVISFLYQKQANVFANLYNYELKEIRNMRKAIAVKGADDGDPNGLTVYRESLGNTIERTIEYIVEYVH